MTGKIVHHLIKYLPGGAPAPLDPPQGPSGKVIKKIVIPRVGALTSLDESVVGHNV